MPLYEYQCAACDTVFELLRPISKAGALASCTHCGSDDTSRALSLFAAFSKGNSGGPRSVSGTGSNCGSCAATSCAGCSH
jgi:putative FmdB family regulatory protein